MLATALIVFREIFEAALIVSIVLAASRGLARRGVWVGAGVLAGLAGAGVVAAFANALAGLLAGAGQEVFNAGTLFLAALMLGWHNVWMSRHGRELSRQMSDVGHAVSAGRRPRAALALVTGLAVLREGAEVVLFLYGIAAAENGRAGMVSGGALGVVGGVAVGVALYQGLLRIPTRRLFAVTGWMILLLAAGMASQGVAFLVQAGLVPSLGDVAWDTSAWLPQHGVAGALLHALIGYVDQPYGIQVLVYGATLVVIGGLMLRYGRDSGPEAPPAAQTGPIVRLRPNSGSDTQAPAQGVVGEAR
jgi:high-affinity iron transporter